MELTALAQTAPAAQSIVTSGSLGSVAVALSVPEPGIIIAMSLLRVIGVAGNVG